MEYYLIHLYTVFERSDLIARSFFRDCRSEIIASTVHASAYILHFQSNYFILIFDEVAKTLVQVLTKVRPLKNLKKHS